ncbi:uncharacterized protein LOC132938331 [Metopolophium dirhodum]|uniref:uncharacterized protein LOC132938331 n=1 Tax=Metopolophium dirhodum TaxID=44670 RepID=UPI00298F9864|nr:uncharacterized protein LOC132938331 [Metopolophium dirhodum]
MHLFNLFLLYCIVPCIIANDITILTDWKKTTLQCMNNFFENTGYLTRNDTNVTIYGLDEKEESMVHNIVLRNFNELMSEYHKTDYLLQEQSQKYYSRLIDVLNTSKNQFLLFGEKSMFIDEDFFLQNHTNVEIVWCKNGECENCKEKMPKPLAIVNQVSEIKTNDDQNQSKNKASDKSWSDEMIDGAKSFRLELSPYSVLSGASGETVKLYFRVINTNWTPMEYNFNCYDQMGLIRSVLPTSIILPPNSPFDVMVVLEVIGPEGSTDQITFSVLHPEFETIKVNFYIGKLTGDTTRPTIDYIFNGDCRFADTPHTCASEKWNVEVTIQDENSGLAMISSIPNNLRFRSEFSIGTKEPVIAYYTATCCFPKFEIIATDLRGNTQKKTIDAEKQYLNFAEISLIVLSAIVLLLLISLLIWSIIRCQRRKRSRDFLSR